MAKMTSTARIQIYILMADQVTDSKKHLKTWLLYLMKITISTTK